MKEGKSRIALDWSRLLGFDQIREHVPADSSLSDPRLMKLGSKVGSKPGSKTRAT